MPYEAMKKIRFHQHLTGRDYAALILVVVVISSFAGTYIQYRNSQHALSVAQSARLALRADRKTTEIKLCRAIDLNRAINNRDRNTFLRSRKETKRDLKIVTDPALHALLVKSLADTARELRIRPYLPPINCKKLVAQPQTTTVPDGTTTTAG